MRCKLKPLTELKTEILNEKLASEETFKSISKLTKRIKESLDKDILMTSVTIESKLVREKLCDDLKLAGYTYRTWFNTIYVIVRPNLKFKDSILVEPLVYTFLAVAVLTTGLDVKDFTLLNALALYLVITFIANTSLVLKYAYVKYTKVRDYQ